MSDIVFTLFLQFTIALYRYFLNEISHNPFFLFMQILFLRLKIFWPKLCQIKRIVSMRSTIPLVTLMKTDSVMEKGSVETESFAESLVENDFECNMNSYCYFLRYQNLPKAVILSFI